MKFKYTIFYVDDVAASLKFYNQAFNIKTKMIHGENDYGELETGDCSLSFCSKNLMKNIGKTTQNPNSKSPVFEIALETNDVSSAYEHAIKNGAKPISAPEHMPWGQDVAYVADLNDYLVEICSPIYQN